MSFGEELRRERELREISLRDISDATKISVRYLQALESNDFTELPGGVFNRGFVRAYAQFIGIDPDGSVDAYIHEESQQAEGEPDDDDRGGMLRGGGRRVRNAGVQVQPVRAPRIWLWFALAVLLIAAAGWMAWSLFLPRTEPAGPGTTRTERPATRPAGSSRAEAGAATVPLPSSRHSGGAVVTRILIDRSTQGTINCDDRQTEKLAGILPGTRLELACSDFIAVDATDGGAIRLGLGGDTPQSLAAPGERVEGYRVSIPDWLAGRDEGPS